RLLRPAQSRRRPTPPGAQSTRQPARRHPPRLPPTPDALRRRHGLGTPPKNRQDRSGLTRCSPGVSNLTTRAAESHTLISTSRRDAASGDGRLIQVELVEGLVYGEPGRFHPGTGVGFVAGGDFEVDEDP